MTDTDWLHGGAPAAIKETLTKGRLGNMPPMAAALGGADDAKNVAQYVLSLSGSPHDSLKAALGKPKFAVCAACHGKDGNSPVDPSYPRLAGQHQDYLRQALLDYHSDSRKNAIMGAQAKALTKKEIGDLAAYYASLPGQLVVRK